MYTMRTDENESRAHDFNCVRKVLLIQSTRLTAGHAFLAHTVE